MFYTNMFSTVLLVCVFLSVSQAVFHRHHHRGYGSHYPQHKTVSMRPAPRRQKLDEEEMNAYLMRQRMHLYEVGKKIYDETSTICRWNYATLTDWQKRSCSCINVFHFLNDSGDPFSDGYEIYMRLWRELNMPGGPTEACGARHPNSPRELHDLCHCLTGQSLV